VPLNVVGKCLTYYMGAHIGLEGHTYGILSGHIYNVYLTPWRKWWRDDFYIF